VTVCPCCAEPWVLGEESAEGDTPWNSRYKFYLYAGTVTSTITTSQAFSISGTTRGQSWDGTDTYITEDIFVGTDEYLRRYSGQFSTTVKDSINVSNVCYRPNGQSWAGDSVYWIDKNVSDRFMETSGKFTSTLRQSVSINTRRNNGISHDTTDTYSQDELFGSPDSKFLKYSGKFSSTLKTSVSLTNVRICYDLTWDGSKLLNCVENFSGGYGRIQVYAGFSSTITDSATIAGVATLFGLNSNNSTVG